MEPKELFFGSQNPKERNFAGKRVIGARDAEKLWWGLARTTLVDRNGPYTTDADKGRLA